MCKKRDRLLFLWGLSLSVLVSNKERDSPLSREKVACPFFCLFKFFYFLLTLLPLDEERDEELRLEDRVALEEELPPLRDEETLDLDEEAELLRDEVALEREDTEDELRLTADLEPEDLDLPIFAELDRLRLNREEERDEEELESLDLAGGTAVLDADDLLKVEDRDG